MNVLKSYNFLQFQCSDKTSVTGKIKIIYFVCFSITDRSDLICTAYPRGPVSFRSTKIYPVINRFCFHKFHSRLNFQILAKILPNELFFTNVHQSQKFPNIELNNHVYCTLLEPMASTSNPEVTGSSRLTNIRSSYSKRKRQAYHHWNKNDFNMGF